MTEIEGQNNSSEMAVGIEVANVGTRIPLREYRAQHPDPIKRLEFEHVEALKAKQAATNVSHEPIHLRPNQTIGVLAS